MWPKYALLTKRNNSFQSKLLGLSFYFYEWQNPLYIKRWEKEQVLFLISQQFDSLRNMRNIYQITVKSKFSDNSARKPTCTFFPLLSLQSHKLYLTHTVERGTRAAPLPKNSHFSSTEWTRWCFFFAFRNRFFTDSDSFSGHNLATNLGRLVWRRKIDQNLPAILLFLHTLVPPIHTSDWFLLACLLGKAVL